MVAGALAISTLASVSSFGAAADSDPETPTLPALNGLIKYQLRDSADETGKDIRFLAVVKQSDVEYGASAEWVINAANENDPDNFQEIEIQPLTYTAYQSVVANGAKVSANDVAKEIWNWSADTEYCFILSKAIGSFTDGDIVDGNIEVLNFSTGLNRIVTFGKSSVDPESSSEAEDSSSKTEPSDDGVIWEGEAALEKWSTKEFSLGVANIPNAKEGGLLTIEGTPLGSTPQVQIATKQGEDWVWTTLESAEGTDAFTMGANGKLQLKLTADQAALLASSNELLLKGQQVIVTKITYKGPDQLGGETEVIWTGSEDLGDWGTDVDLKVAGIPLAEKDGILTVKYDGNGAAQIQIVNKLGENWTWTPMVSDSGDEFFDTQGGTLQIVLNETQAAQLAASKGIFLKGSGAVVTEITYTSPGKKPVEDSSSKADESSSKTEDSSSTAEPSEEEVIWEGSEDLNNWKDDIELGVAGIPLAEEGGILTVEYTATGAAQIQIVNKLGENWTWTPMETADGNEYFDTVGGKLQIKLTAAQAEALAASKAMFLKGTGAVVTKITYKGANVGPVVTETIWEGEEDLNAWKADINLGVAGIPLAEENGILTIEYTAAGAAQIQVINKLGDNWTWTPMETAAGNDYFDTTGGKLQIKLTAQQAAELAAGKEMHLKGTGAIVTKITYTAPNKGNNPGPATAETIWEGEEDLNAWKADINLGVAGIPLAEENGILTIEYTAAGAAQIQVINKLGDNWTWTPMETAAGNDYFDTTGGKLQIKLTAQQAAELAAGKEMHLKGTGAIVTKITYTAPGSSSGTTETIWTGSEDLGDWGTDVDLKVAGIPLAEEGGILTIIYEAEGAAQIQVVNKLGDAWTWTPMETAEGNEYFDTQGGKLQIKLTATQAEQLATSKAIFLKGTGAVVTEITYTSK